MRRPWSVDLRNVVVDEPLNAIRTYEQQQECVVYQFKFRNIPGPCSKNRAVFAAIISLALALAPKLAFSSICSVPGSHSTVQAAIDDSSCSAIELANQSYSELLEVERSVDLAGPIGGSSEILGKLHILNVNTIGTLSNFQMQGSCSGGTLRVTGGAQITAVGLRVTGNNSVPCKAELIFRDGFED